MPKQKLNVKRKKRKPKLGDIFKITDKDQGMEAWFVLESPSLGAYPDSNFDFHCRIIKSIHSPEGNFFCDHYKNKREFADKGEGYETKIEKVEWIDRDENPEWYL